MCTSAAVLAALFASAVRAEIPQEARDAQFVVLGEQHDNPAHHTRQAEWVAALNPKALVFEMLTPEQGKKAHGAWSNQAELDALIGWSETAWPSFEMYYPIFAAAPEAIIYGAGLTRSDLEGLLERPLGEYRIAAKFGFERPVDKAEQTARETLQAEAHCSALPEDLLPMMVDAQRFRDIWLADAALRALERTGGPVVIVTGNGHARTDWGMPALVAYAAPEITVFTLAQGEDGSDVGGGFSLTLDAPAPERGDPCDAFAQ
ncbi:ChaN family lipoprotein [uncultured Sulfitobacter sp.]|uniref:ChaN family lipoprotein n=1 Tax=uncultured Sulfitobacter sp. TaxID=191468 RepID=UPI00262CF275|nr:ChaN family lipoprotein [uncultured Sulfitobacter sp.]